MSLSAFPHDPWFYAIGFLATFLMGLGKGAFGGGLAILGIPLLALTMEPIPAAVVTALLVAFMDFFALGSFPRSAWSKPDLVWLIPGLIGGLFVGFLVFELVDKRWVALVIALITLGYTVRYFVKPATAAPDMGVSPAFALAASAAAGFTTYVAHAGGPPLAMYLLRRDLTKSAYAATTIVVFTIGNLIKLPGYIYTGLDTPEVFTQALALAPMVPVGVLIGRRLHGSLPREKLYGLCYALVGLAGAKLLWDAVRALITP